MIPVVLASEWSVSTRALQLGLCVMWTPYINLWGSPEDIEFAVAIRFPTGDGYQRRMWRRAADAERKAMQERTNAYWDIVYSPWSS